MAFAFAENEHTNSDPIQYYLKISDLKMLLFEINVISLLKIKIKMFFGIRATNKCQTIEYSNVNF